MPDFAVIDMETANADLASICQIGIAVFRDHQLCETFKSLVNPCDYFSPVNVQIHGIDEEQVQDAPVWREIYPEILARLEAGVVVSHTAFDRIALRKACICNELPVPELTWLDSARVVRRTWPEFSHAGYGLSNVAANFGISYEAHDALEDAICAGRVLLKAVSDSGIGIDGWLTRAGQPISSIFPPASSPYAQGNGCTRSGNPEGDLYGEIVVFSGALSIPRREAADAAAAVGCEVDQGVTKNTTILVVGDQDVRHLVGHEKSAKHLKAEALIKKGQPIRILCEADFRRMASLPDSSMHGAAR
jgi:DNA polymerase-3 subunit epsilon